MERKVELVETKTVPLSAKLLARQKELRQAANIVSSICNKNLSTKQLAELHPEIISLYDDRELMKILYDTIAKRRYIFTIGSLGPEQKKAKVSCAGVQFDKLSWLTGKGIVSPFYHGELIKELLDSLIIHNQDGTNSEPIVKLLTLVKKEELPQFLSRVLEVLEELVEEKKGLRKGEYQELTLEEARKGILNSLPLIFGRVSLETANVPEMYRDFLLYTYKIDKSKNQQQTQLLTERIDLLNEQELNEISNYPFPK